jgi:light-regulated signal transduction histidine kinase (bacteriophytochrome)
MNDKTLLQTGPAESGAPPGETDLTAIAEGIVGRLQASAPGRMADVVVMRGLRTSVHFEGARTVLEDILGSAWEHTAKRTVPLLVFGAKPDGGVPIYYVRDNGEGFDGTRSGHFFMCLDRFAIAPRDPDETRPLAAARRIIAALGGRFWAEPAAGHGVIVYFTLEGEGPRVA